MSTVSPQSWAPQAGEVAYPAARQTTSGSQSRSRVLNQFSWAFAGNLLYAACHCGLVVALAKVGSPEIVGQFALALAVGGPVFFFTNLQLRAVLASDAAQEHRFEDYWRLRLLSVPVAIGVVAIIVIAQQYRIETALVILAMAAAKVIESFSDICHGANQQRDRLDLVGKSLLIKGPLTLLLLAVVVASTGSLLLGITAIGAGWALLFYLYDLPNGRQYRGGNEASQTDCDAPTQPQNNHLRAGRFQPKLFATGLPLGIAMSLMALTVALPNLLIGRILGEGLLGIFSAMTTLTWLCIPLVNAMGQTAMPRLGRCHAAGDYADMRRVVFRFSGAVVLLGFLATAVLWLAGAPLMRLCFGPEYAQHQTVLVWLMAAASALYTGRFVADALTAMRCTKVQIAIQLITAAALLLAGAAVTPQYGLLGLAKLMLAVYLMRVLAMTGCFLHATKCERRVVAALTPSPGCS